MRTSPRVVTREAARLPFDATVCIVILDIRASTLSPERQSACGCQKLQMTALINAVWHRILYSCSARYHNGNSGRQRVATRFDAVECNAIFC